MAASPQTVWDVLADFGALSSWAANIDHSCLLTPAADGVGPGTCRRVQVGRDTLVERITEFDPPRALAYDVDGFAKQVRRITNRWALSPTGDRTDVTLTSTIEIGPRLAQRAAEHVALRLGAKHLDALLTGLSHRLESAHD